MGRHQQEGYKTDGSASPEELRLWVETQFPGILRLTILGEPRRKARLARLEKAKAKAQKAGKKQKTAPEPPPSPINIPDHADHLLHSLLTDAHIGSGIFMMKRVDGQSHFLSFSGAGGVFSDREGHVYRVGTLKQLTQTLIDAGYVWGDHPGAGSSPTFISAMALLVNARSVNLRNLNSIYLCEHSSWDLAASGSKNMEPARRAGYRVIKKAIEDLSKARRFHPGAQVRVHVNPTRTILPIGQIAQFVTRTMRRGHRSCDFVSDARAYRKRGQGCISMVPVDSVEGALCIGKVSFLLRMDRPL